MNAFLCTLTGDSATTLAKHTAQSRKKVIAIGMSLLLVTGIWAVIGFLLGHTVLVLGILPSLFMAAAMAMVIFAVDRSIILVRTKGLGVWAVRIPLAVLGAYLGTIGLDQALFDADIRQVVSEMREQRLLEIEDDHMNKSRAHEQFLRKQLAAASQAHATALEGFHAEMNGTGGSSGYRGFGQIAQQKAKAVDSHQREMDRAQSRLDAFEQTRDQRIQQTLVNAQANFQDGTFLERMVALHTFLAKEPLALWFVFAPLLAFMMLVELIPLYLKNAGEQTAYELELTVAEMLRQERAKAIMHDQQRWLERERNLSVEARHAETFLAGMDRSRKAMRPPHLQSRSAA